MRHILITGGAGEIGAACARLLSAPDTCVHLVDPNAERLERVLASMGAAGPVSVDFHAEVTH